MTLDRIIYGTICLELFKVLIDINLKTIKQFPQFSSLRKMLLLPSRNGIQPIIERNI